MSAKVIYEDEVEYFCKKGKWKRCSCTINVISRVKNIVQATITEMENHNILENFDIYGYECGVNFVEFIFIGLKECYTVRFKDLKKMMELKKLLGTYVEDISFFLLFNYCTKPEVHLKLNEWYKLHVQTNRVCLKNKEAELIKIWNIMSMDVEVINLSLSITIKTDKDCVTYSFYRADLPPLMQICTAISNRKHRMPIGHFHYSNLTKRRSECADLKRFNSYSNPMEMRHNIRNRTASENNASLFAASMPSTPVCALMNSSDALHNHEDMESALVFQMDTLESYSEGSNEIYNNDSTNKSNCEFDDGISTESDCPRKVELERFPYEAECKSKVNVSPSSMTKDCLPDNNSISSRPNNGKYYLSLSSLRNGQYNSKISLDTTFIDSDKRAESGVFSSSEISESNILPNQYININYDNTSMETIKDIGDLSNLYCSSSCNDDSKYYNLANLVKSKPKSLSIDQHYSDFETSTQTDLDYLQTNSEKEKVLNYVTLDLVESSSGRMLKTIPNQDLNSKYTEIDIKNTEALKSLEFSFPKPSKKTVFRSIFKKKQHQNPSKGNPFFCKDKYDLYNKFNL